MERGVRNIALPTTVNESNETGATMIRKTTRCEIPITPGRVVTATLVTPYNNAPAMRYRRNCGLSGSAKVERSRKMKWR